MSKGAPKSVATLLASRRLARGSVPQAPGSTLTTGMATLDRALHTGGYPRGGITELIGNGPRHRLAAAAFAAASQTGEVAYLSQDLVLHPDVLAGYQARLATCHVLLEQDPLRLGWAAQQILASGHFALLVCYGSDWRTGAPLLDPLAYRRLSGLARQHDAVVLLILDHHPSLPTFARPCALRLQVSAANVMGQQRAQQIHVAVTRQAGAAPGATVELEVL